MTQREADEKRKLTRRVFIQYSAAMSGAAAGVYAITLKTDAMAQEGKSFFFRSDGSHSYPYQ